MWYPVCENRKPVFIQLSTSCHLRRKGHNRMILHLLEHLLQGLGEQLAALHAGVEYVLCLQGLPMRFENLPIGFQFSVDPKISFRTLHS